MGEGEAPRLAEDLAFFGRVTASTTHQINNVLTIVAELGGLIDDLVRLEAEGRPLSGEKLADIAARIQRHVDRGVGYVERLNAFAHAVDSPEETVDAGRAIAGLTALASRLAELRRSRLVCRVPEAPLPLRTRPFRLLRLVHLGIEAALAGAERGREVTVAARPGAAGLEVEIASSEALDRTDETAALLDRGRGLAAELSGELRVAAGDPARLVIMVPAAPAGSG